MKRGFVKNSVENAPRSPLGKQLHFTQAQLNRNKDFVVLEFGFFQSGSSGQG